jgi:DNA-binding NarL/FixJ family response regulator
MQTDAVARQTGQSEAGQEELARKLRALLTRISALRALTREEEDEDLEGESAPDMSAVRRGLRELEQMADELLYELQSGGELLLADLPGIPLAEALSQLVETTAETLELSSRIIFSGRERPLPDYLSRLLYRIAQEVLARISTHAGARKLRFSMDYRRSEVVMGVEDDGVPDHEEQLLGGAPDEAMTFPPFLGAVSRGSSELLAVELIRRLRSMVESLGGVLAINSGVEQGTQVQVRMPYKMSEHSEEPPALATSQTGETVAKIRLLIVDAHAVSRAGLRRLLESYADLEVVGEAGDSVQAVSETAELLPQVVLIDAQLPGEQSLEILRQVRQLNTDIHLLLLSGQENEELLYEALRAGAGGYVLKDVAPDELAQMVRTVARGEVLLQPQLAARLLARFSNQERNRGAGPLQEGLTAREQEVLQLLARGLRNKEIAARLFVSERTVNFHLANIYAKLHVSGRTEALSKALERGLIKV